MSSPRTPGRRTRSLLGNAVVALLVITLLVAALPVPPASAGSSTWTKPVPGSLVRPYREPLAQFASGHRGVDYAAPAGTPVRAANAGTVTFAGTVGGEQHVVVAHAGGIRTTYSYLASVDVPVGARVARGAVLGTAGGSGSGHGRGVVHFGARVGSRYFDPMLLFEPTDLTKLVHLAPTDTAQASDEELLRLVVHEESDDACGGGLLEIVCDIGGAIGDVAEATWDEIEVAIDLGIAALRAVADIASELVDRVESIVRDVLRTLRDVANDVAGAVEALAAKIANGAVAVFNAVVEAGLELYEQLTSCPQPPPKAHSLGSGNQAIAVGGLGSWRRRQPTDRHGDAYDEKFQTRWRMLGYQRDEVAHFSYRPGSATYGPKDTITDLHAQARSLGRQVQEADRAHPGLAVDLVGHSQGGLVIDLFLTEVYAGHEHEYPPIENVVTFGSPHEGTPIADLAEAVDEHLFAGIAARALDPTDYIGAESVEQMSTGSSTIEELWDAGGVPPEVRFLSIVGSEDPIVPSSSASVPGGTKIVVPAGDTLWPDDHSAVLRDDDAISAAQAHLSGRAPADSCGLFTDVGGWLYTQLVDKVTAKVSETPGGTSYVPNLEKYLP